MVNVYQGNDKDYLQSLEGLRKMLDQDKKYSVSLNRKTI